MPTACQVRHMLSGSQFRVGVAVVDSSDSEVREAVKQHFPGFNGYAWIRRAIVLEHSNTLDARQAGPIAKKGGESCFLSSFGGVIVSPRGTGESCMCP
jgi:hypothetical protein